ncbi:ParB/RepB/Spo0J family partition protein [Priestia taiwanensis]|uniref:Chromosome partitioning protein ParB n=1 Tax=Priestia taiwanensis TaxID=1347902 RepID=A0A917AWI4_9BACI|nr:ParB/RepB/Spo0J family partition protein [Priestia taiwanensis]MBM7364854.1 ParB family chromosome partitioning protein [Priestia taiwanensis]GGE83162.1 chromosome partitioning protein ParB [Priestia taiwanensis]
MAKGLGKGINAFFPDLEVQSEDLVKEIKLTELRPNPYQPRKVFQQEAIEELKQSILIHGVLQPIIVRKSIKGYEIVVGERRFRASKEAGLKTIPAVARKLTEQQMMELALLENLQREDLTPIEEAIAYDKLMSELELTQEQLASRLGKSRPHIANYVRLLTLPSRVQEMITTSELSMAHGRTLLGVKNKEHIMAIVEKIKKEQLNVRQVEQLVQELNKNVSRETSTLKQKKNIFYQEYEDVLTERFGTAVTIKEKNERGKIEIQFFNKEDLNRILELLDKHEE